MSLTHFVILTARNTYPEQQPQVNETFFLPLFTQVRGTGILGTSHADVHVPLREVLLGELGGGRYLLDDIHHDATRSPADEVALPGG